MRNNNHHQPHHNNNNNNNNIDIIFQNAKFVASSDRFGTLF